MLSESSFSLATFGFEFSRLVVIKAGVEIREGSEFVTRTSPNTTSRISVPWRVSQSAKKRLSIENHKVSELPTSSEDTILLFVVAKTIGMGDVYIRVRIQQSLNEFDALRRRSPRFEMKKI